MKITVDTIKEAEKLQEELASRKSINREALSSRLMAISGSNRYRELDTKMIWLRAEEALLKDVDDIMGDLIVALRSVGKLQIQLELLDKAQYHALMEGKK